MPSPIFYEDSDNLPISLNPVEPVSHFESVQIPGGISISNIHQSFENYLNVNSPTSQQRGPINLDCYSCGDPMVEPSDFSFCVGRLWCSQCSERTLRECPECHEIRLNTDIRDVYNSEGSMCVYCARVEELERCRDCGIFSQDEQYCPNCREGREEGGIELRPYNPLPEFVEDVQGGKTLISARPIGVEMEVQYPTRKKLNEAIHELPEYVGVGTDSSISGNGVEIRLPPASGVVAENMTKNVCDTLKKHGFKTDSSCGLHIHFEMKDIDDLTASNQLVAIQSLWMLYLSFEDVILSFLPPSRRSSRYCKVFRSEYRLDEIDNCKNMDQIERTWYRAENMHQIVSAKSDSHHESRYRGINLHPLFSARHMEVRYHTGTIQANKILQWANLHTRMIDMSINGELLCNDIEWYKTQLNDTDLNRKTNRLFSLLKLSNKTRGYFLARQAAFFAAPKFTKNADFESGVAELNAEKEI